MTIYPNDTGTNPNPNYIPPCCGNIPISSAVIRNHEINLDMIKSNTLNIDCEKIVLNPYGVDITVDIPMDFEKIDIININGLKFIKEK